MPSDYKKIREENIEEYGRGTRHLSYLGMLYTDRTHFVFELIQNAEDAGASQMLFRLYYNRLEVQHDGRIFTDFDVRGLCGVGEGKKADDLTLIGKFGIGFKSVYAYTSRPEVHSGDENFQIQNFVRPYPIEAKNVGDKWTTLFVFPFDAENIDPEISYREISERLSNLNVRTLLFLKSIDEIEYILPDHTSGVYVREKTNLGSARRVIVIGKNDNQDEEENWLIFERPVKVSDGSYTVRVELGFQLENSAKDKSKSIIKVLEAPIVVYFPTEKLTRFGFLIQGPYRTTLSRDNIPKDDDWNANLILETSILIKDALRELKEMGLLTVSLLEVLPIRNEDFLENSMFYPIFSRVRETLMNEELLPADDGTFVAGQNSKLARGSEFRKLLNHYQLRSLLQTQSETKWLDGMITQDRTPELRTYLIKELNIEEITPTMFTRMITINFLEEQSDEWFIKFYSYLSDNEVLWRAPRWEGDKGGVFRSVPILRLEDNSHMIPFKSDGNPNAFLPPPEGTDFPILKRDIVRNEKALDFLKRLGISEPDIFDEIVEKVLPKYNKPEVSLITLQEHDDDIQKILRAMDSDSEAGKKKVLRAVMQTPCMRAIDYYGKITYKNPQELYINSEELKRYFVNTSGVWFLDETEVDLTSEFDPWTKLGVDHLPRRIQFLSGFPDSEREHSTRDETIENYDIHGLAEFLEFHQSLSDIDEQKELSILLWCLLDEHLEANPNFFKGRYKWFYYNPASKFFDCQILMRLREAKWIPTRNNGIKRPAEATTSQLIDECIGSNELIEALGILRGSVDTELSEEQNRRKHANELGISLEDIDFLKNNYSEFQKFRAKSTDSSFPVKSVINPERRRDKLTELLDDAPEKEYEKRERSVRTTRGEIESSQWLKSLYTNESGQMVCQVCEEEMPFRKRNGEYYFEALEALSKEHLPKEHEAQFLALCPLCAAMYKEFVKNDEEAMRVLKNAILSSNNEKVPIALGDKESSIRFVEKHIHDIKMILEQKIPDS